MALNKPTVSSSYQALGTPIFQETSDLAVDGKAEPDINQKSCFLSASRRGPDSILVGDNNNNNNDDGETRTQIVYSYKA
nr:hypothetical protein BaRGS_022312 [Batillaria attramentaria]